MRKKNRAVELEDSAFLTLNSLQSCSHPDSMVLAEKQKYGPVKQDRKPTDKPRHLWIAYV